MATLRVCRPDDYGGRYRSIAVYIDGQRVAGLRPNRAVSFEVHPGRHEVLGRMDWVRSQPVVIDLAAGDQAVVELSLPFRAIIDTFLRPGHAIRSRGRD